MRSFLKGRKLWQYVTGDIKLFEKSVEEPDDKFVDRLEEWDSKNHQIITWFRNTSTSSINLQFARYDTAKEVWDLLAKKYTTSDLSSQYQLWEELHSLKQERDESITSFYAKWKLFGINSHFLNQHLIALLTMRNRAMLGFLMALIDDYEPCKASLLHQSPLPTLDNAISRLLSDETLLKLLRPQQVDIVLATMNRNSLKGGQKFCRHCNKPGHVLYECNLVEFHKCAGSADRIDSWDRISGEFTNEQPTTMPSPNEFPSVDTAPETIEAENIYVASSSNHLTQVLEKTSTWDLVDLPTDKTLVGCKWVYKIKTRSNGFVERYKAHLVAKGFTHECGIDYVETFAPIVACLTTIRSLLAITEEVYMKPLLALIILHINIGDDISSIHELNQFLNQKFEMKDLGPLSYILGLEVTSSDDGCLLSQAKYAFDLISKAGLIDSKIASTPFEPNAWLTPMDGSPLRDPTVYRQLVGSLVYLTVTRPDIAYAVHIVSQFMTSPRFTHYATVLHIIRYVKGTLFHGLHFSAHSSLVLCAYFDADWAGDPTDRKTTIGYCLFFRDSFISWRSKKQTFVSRSNTEAKYRALANTVVELLWICWLLEDIGVS
ncbi:hypothetical protein SLEP1_g22904 [Rubroshorea leprosula]|uniref:Reverse transcriptase Ty1/copia-type domain-containing protein n=1 Tax=Rubroshorea leprosula TaxID=152421 RepID=A0AAV5JAL7_9ROSI|nr:hypothetical protein SLEP1_g22904 [Rubroshorea leprosula]